MGGAGCCNNKAFGVPCADCAFDDVSMGQVDDLLQRRRAMGTSASLQASPQGPLFAAIEWGVLSSSGQARQASDFWPHMVAETIRRAPANDGSPLWAAAAGAFDALSPGPGECGGVLCAPSPADWEDPNPEDPDWRKFAEELGENPHRGGDSGWDPPETEPEPEDDEDEECCCEAVDIKIKIGESRTLGGPSELGFRVYPIVRARHGVDTPGSCSLTWEELGNSAYRPARGTPVVPADKRVDLTEHPVFKGNMAKQAFADLEDPCNETISPILDVPRGGPGRWIIFHIVLRSGCPDGPTIERWMRFWVDGEGAHLVGLRGAPPAWNEAPRGRFR